LGPHFRHVEVVCDKSAASHARLLQRHRLAPERFLIVDNSLRTGILTVLERGASAVYNPYVFTWAHERAERPGPARPGYYELEHLGWLANLLDRIDPR
jgi:putative hydrolase of the HAD superfamily